VVDTLLDNQGVQSTGRQEGVMFYKHHGLFGVDDLGLDKVDRAILSAIAHRFGGGPVGLSTLAISVGEPTETVEDVYEPFLIQQGLLVRTPRGRVALPAAWEHLGLAAPAPPERPGGLFDQM
jgi:Holliday junction DNA helicase RuvB